MEIPPEKNLLYRMWKKPQFMHYNRLFTLIALINLGLFINMIVTGAWNNDISVLQAISKIVIINLFIGIIVRQQYVINFFFKVATSAPTSWPLSIRRHLGKVYHFGGIHMGGTVSGTFWFGVLIFTLTRQYLAGAPHISIALLSISICIVALLIGIVIMALPPIRAKNHDFFELSHRLGGWSSLILFWIFSFSFAANVIGEGYLEQFFKSLDFWLLTTITVSIILPWLRLRKVPVDVVKPSNHAAIAKFDYGVTPFAGSSTALSLSPLKEWHSFANIPWPKADGFRLTISRAGDWTGNFIDKDIKHVWVRGIPTAGVGNIDQLFKKVIWVATGSGIGPCLPHLLANEIPSQLIWATRNPEKTYGKALVDEIRAVQPNAIFWNTDAYGKPDMVKLTYKAYKEFGAEAVICISNKKLTWNVVKGMESRGIPAYGAIWDS
ncbi:hypothetical protein N9F08_00940 [bacterium]|nr:hypothetical protein [bacterium]